MIIDWLRGGVEKKFDNGTILQNVTRYGNAYMVRGDIFVLLIC